MARIALQEEVGEVDISHTRTGLTSLLIILCSHCGVYLHTTSYLVGDTHLEESFAVTLFSQVLEAEECAVILGRLHILISDTQPVDGIVVVRCRRATEIGETAIGIGGGVSGHHV